MKKILISIILLMSVVNAKPCMTDIYFGNGMWSKSREQQIASLKALEVKLNFDSNTKKNIDFKLAYNPGNGHIEDLIEIYWQLKESGQITSGYFTTVAIVLSGSETSSEFSKAMTNIVLNYQEEITGMYRAYSEASFKQKHNVLLVAHSQGTLHANKIYGILNDAQKKKFRIVAVGTVADTVAGGGNYVNVKDDWIVNKIPNSLKGNFDGLGHVFRGVYLNIADGRHWYDIGSINAGAQIVSYVKSAYNNLRQTTSCTLYDGIYMKLYELDYMDVYAFTVTGLPRLHDKLKTMTLTKYPATVDVNGQTTCGSNTVKFGQASAFESCSYGTPRTCNWSLGSLYESIIEAREGLEQQVLYQGKCTKLSLTGELYELSKNALIE